MREVSRTEYEDKDETQPNVTLIEFEGTGREPGDKPPKRYDVRRGTQVVKSFTSQKKAVALAEALVK